MSDDKLSQLVQSAIGEAVAHNLGPILKWLYGVFATIIVGTAFVVGMVYDVRASIKTAQDDAAEAKRRSAELSDKVTAHDKSIGILEDRRKGGE